ncbi:polyprenyl diphosphate synthase [Rothia mucilaginosa]|uniref:polyprenyl diphosphate synthase n=1 Tax=Rothia mucilaginosa TaxID=43675 RepID=UPI003A84B539
MSANALPVITVHGHASNPGTVTEPTVYEQALARSLSPESLPAHIGVLVDGNRRWAAQRGLSTREGHAAGAERIIDFLAWCTELSIPQVSLYMLSTENLKRPEKELTGLVAVIDAFLVRLVESACGPVCAIGNIDLIPRQLHERLDWAIEQTAHLPGVRVNIAVGYGGRQEIVDAVRSVLREAAAEGASLDSLAEQLSVEDISLHLYTADMPDPDLLIRTSGEQRLSGFMTWQSAYSEFYFCRALWPDFTRVDFLRALRDYANRSRRFGS